ncbi:MAG: FkbM family methyltransferase [Verrucomicrobiota bacterium]|jgi:FkbM family methyltransferase
MVEQFRRRMLKFGRFRRPASQFEVEAAEWAFYISYLREGMVVFDLGTYLGELTVLFSHFVRENGHVHGFEANSKTFERVRKICELSNAGNVTLNHLAVSDKDGELDLHVYGETRMSWSSLALRPLRNYGIEATGAYIEKVRAITIDRYCEERKIEKIDLLKIDVEGAEYQVLQGAAKALEQKRIRCCVFEFGQTTFDMGNRPGEIQEFLSDKGYSLRNVIAGDPVFPGGAMVETAAFSMHVAVPRLL